MTQSAHRPDDIFPSLKMPQAWQPASAPPANAHIPAMNSREFSYLVGYENSVLIDRSALKHDFRFDGDTLDDIGLQQRAISLMQQIESKGPNIPRHIATQMAAGMAVMNEPATMYLVAPAHKFNSISRPKSNHPLMAILPSYGKSLRPAYVVHQPFSPQMSAAQRIAEISLLDTPQIERVPAQDDSDALHQLEGLCRANSHLTADKTLAAHYTQELAAFQQTRDGYLNEAGGKQSSWDAHAASAALGSFFNRAAKQQPILSILDPKLGGNHERVDMAMRELRVRALANAKGDEFPWSSREFRSIYAQTGNSASEQQIPLNIIVSKAKNSGRLAMMIWMNEENFGDFMFNGKEGAQHGTPPNMQTKHAFALVQGAAKVLESQQVAPTSDVARVANIVRSAGMVLAPKAMGYHSK